MGQIRTKYLESLMMDPVLMGKAEPTTEGPTYPSLQTLLETITEKPTRPSRMLMVGARKNQGSRWAILWLATAPTHKLAPLAKVAVLNWTTARGTGKLEKSRKRMRLQVNQ